MNLYNENNPYAAQWLRNLIAAGHIASGVVDERSIVDLDPAELERYVQCHFYAGIGVWSHALRLAGWPDDRPVWTGSCPCQPFSSAGKGGGHEDERHLWPAWLRLIRERRPVDVFGEQVASSDGLAWLDVVCTDMEGEGYAIGAADLSAAGVGAPHIRQRLFFVAHPEREPARGWRRGVGGAEDDGRGAARQQWLRPDAGAGDLAGLMADADGEARGRATRSAISGNGDEAVRSGPSQPGRCGSDGALADAVGPGRGEQRGRGQPRSRHARPHADEHHQGHRLLGDASGAGLSPSEPAELRGSGRRQEGRAAGEPSRSFWADADWIACRDGKARPVEPGTFPLAHGAPARVGRLRAYGNAIVAPLAAEFVMASM